MTILYELTRSGRKLVDDEPFLHGNRTYDRETWENHLQETDLTYDHERLRERIDEVMDPDRRGDAKIDRDLAPTVHQAVDLTPREAARAGIWHYLAVVEFPNFVRHRWPPEDTQRTTKSMREKFLGSHRDIYSNAFHRLWWMAELTHDTDRADEYELTEKALNHQRLANTIFDRDFHRSPDVVQACVEVLEGASNDVIEDVTYRVNHGFSAVSLEAMPSEEIQSRIGDVLEDVSE